jgi:hypothetical protein
MYAEQFLKQSLEYSSGSKKIDKLRAEVLEQFHKVFIYGFVISAL